MPALISPAGNSCKSTSKRTPTGGDDRLSDLDFNPGGLAQRPASAATIDPSQGGLSAVFHCVLRCLILLVVLLRALFLGMLLDRFRLFRGRAGVSRLALRIIPLCYTWLSCVAAKLRVGRIVLLAYS